MKMNNPTIYIIVLIVLMLVIGVGVGMLAGRRFGKSRQYDERQLLAQGQATKYAYYTLMACLAAYVLYDSQAEASILTAPVGVFMCVCVSVMVYAVACIVKDAYIAFNASRGVQMFAFALIGVSNAALGIMRIIDGTMLQDGRLQPQMINLTVGIMGIVIAAALAIRTAMQKKENRREDEADE